MFEQTRWFKPEGSSSKEWHAYKDRSPVGLCEEVTLRYNHDEVTDVIPSGEEPHAKCKEIFDAEQKA